MAQRKPSPAKTDGGAVNRGESVSMVSLSRLHLDAANPRLSGFGKSLKSEADVLDLVVDEFGIDDILSSIAVNGYFGAEPLIGIRDPDDRRIRIVEGNRRLAACLILADDPRAARQIKRVQQYRAIQVDHKQSPIAELPVLVYDEADYSEKLLSYLGVRHIAASQPWDSHAKATWIAKVLEETDQSLEDISQMIGDQHRTVARLLEGYYFVQQLCEEGRFNPRDSLRRGRGSNPDFPFSWVYTALGYQPVRKWLGLDDLSEGKKKNPVPKKHLEDAGDLMVFLLGNKSRGQAPAIRDSREIADLAIAVGNTEQREMLRHGKTIDEIEQMFQKPITIKPR